MQQGSLNSAERRTGVSLALVYVFRMLGLFMVIPVLAVAAQEFEDYSELLVGIAIGGYGLTQAMLQIPFGILSDIWGRKQVIYLGLAFFTAGSVIAGVADSLTMLTLGRIMQGAGAIAGAVMALASDVTRESQRPKVMAIIGVSIGFSFYIALLLGPVIGSAFGLQGIFLFTAALALCCFPLVQFGVTRPVTQIKNTDNLPVVAHIPALFRHKHLWRLNLLVLALHLLITTFFIQIPVMLINNQVELGQHYQVYLIILVASIVGLVLLLRLSSTLTLSNLMNLSLILMAAGFVIMTQQPNHLYIVICGISFFSGFNFLEAKMPAMVSSIAPAGQKGSAMGIYASFQFFGAFVGGTLAGVFGMIGSPEYALYFCLVIIFVCSMVARGLNDIEKVKRLSISYQQYRFDEDTIVQCIDNLMDLDGVKDIYRDAHTQQLYMKVDINLFDVAKARQCLQQAAESSNSVL